MVDWEAIFKMADEFWAREHKTATIDPVQEEPKIEADPPEYIAEPETRESRLRNTLYRIEEHAGRQSMALMHTMDGFPIAHPEKYRKTAKTLSALLGEEMRVRAHGATEDLATYTLDDATLERYGLNGRELENYLFASGRIDKNVYLTVGFWNKGNTNKMDSVLETYKKELIGQLQ